MYSTKPVTIPARTWVNLNTLSGVPAGVEIWLQNLNRNNPFFYQTQADMPTQPFGWEVHQAGTPLSIQGIPANRPAVWGYAETETRVNVQRG